MCASIADTRRRKAQVGQLHLRAGVLSEGNTAPRMTFPLLGIALESVLAMREKGQPNSSEKGYVLPAIAKTYLNSLRSAAILDLAAS